MRSNMLTLSKPWKLFSLTTKDVSNHISRGKLSSAVTNMVIHKNLLLCDSLWSWKLHSIPLRWYLKTRFPMPKVRDYEKETNWIIQIVLLTFKSWHTKLENIIFWLRHNFIDEQCLKPLNLPQRRDDFNVSFTNGWDFFFLHVTVRRCFK